MTKGTTYELEAVVGIAEYGEPYREVTLRGFSIEAYGEREAEDELYANLEAGGNDVVSVRIVGQR